MIHVATLPNGDELSILLETIDIEKNMTINLRRHSGTTTLSIEYDDVIPQIRANEFIDI